MKYCFESRFYLTAFTRNREPAFRPGRTTLSTNNDVRGTQLSNGCLHKTKTRFIMTLIRITAAPSRRSTPCCTDIPIATMLHPE
ncbi:MAG: hypothetical protein WBM02_08070 [bacterium]